MKSPEFNEDDKLFSPEKLQKHEDGKIKQFENFIPKEKTPEELRKIAEIRDTLQEKIKDEILGGVKGV